MFDACVHTRHLSWRGVHQSALQCSLESSFLRRDWGKSLLNLNIAAGERAAGGILVTHADGKRVRASIAAVIRYAGAVCNSRSVAQPDRAAEVGATASNGESSDFGLTNGDSSGGIAEGQ
jgi:hypothetical protein